MDYIMELEGLSKSYGGKKVVDSFSLKMEKGHIYGLIGPNGAGKTTVMKMMAGLTGADCGSMRFFGSEDLDAMRDRISFIIEEPYMDMNMTARENMAFALKMRKMPKAEIDKKVEEAAKMLDITHLLDRLPKQMSGGQRQRVAMGRAIVRDPKVFLFDEPLSNLDASLRTQMRVELKRLHERLKTTIIYVTHDQV
ncbi:MAG: ABC transporter ATP-binding protein, partial [Lachnospiraceae bacterium]|nr:ABC transporter ATP-binding protein [Lachnospiraceae bacterium]